MVLAGDKGTNMAYFVRVQVAIVNKLLYVKMLPGDKTLSLYSFVKYTLVSHSTTMHFNFLKLLDRILLYLFRGWSVITSFLMTS